ncbi:MAG: glycosyltransferase [Symploca sp. SIO2E6]|nr:glycosyltransferase [Symploca sp. SIO2E6]
MTNDKQQTTNNKQQITKDKQLRLASLLLLTVVVLTGAVVLAWAVGVGQIEELFAQLHLLQEHPPAWVQTPMVMVEYLLAPTVILLVIAIAITKVSPEPRPWSRVVVVGILLGLLIRYILWRSLSTLNLTDPLNGFFSLGLLVMEMLVLAHSIIQLFLMLRWKNRRSQADWLSQEVLAGNYLPTVDILVPTYDEPTFILKRTIIGCQSLDYPHKTIYLLDDTRRSEVEQLAQELGCEYITRPDNRHAKAGNLNHALGKTQGELVTVFDADFIPTKNFLHRTVGFFQDERVALVQTPQSFYNIDPIASNLGLENVLTPEEEVLYRQIQPIRDAAGGVICTGTSFVARRSALNQVGCFFTQSITEDFFTGIRLSAQGFRLVYLDEKLSAGLAAENIAAHATQRLRWARGTLQAFFVDANPLTIPGLRPLQRLAYVEGLFHWFGSIPRCFFLLIPLAYSFLEAIPVRATPQELLYYFLPYYVVNITVYSWLNYRSRSALISEIYSLILTIPLAITAIAVMWNPFSQGFKVTPKGIRNNRFYFNRRLALPLMIMFIATALSLWQNLCICIVKGGGVSEIAQQLQGISLGAIWSTYNLVMLGISLLILIDIPQSDIYEWFNLRRVVRIQFNTQETWGHGDAGTRRHGDAGTRRHGDAETRGHGDAGTRGHGDAETRRIEIPPHISLTPEQQQSDKNSPSPHLPIPPSPHPPISPSPHPPTELWGVTSCISEVGAQVELTQAELPTIPAGESLPVTFSLPQEKISLPAEISNTSFQGEFPSLRVTFKQLSLSQQRRLVEMLYCRPGQWKRQDVPGELQSLWLLLKIVLRPKILFDRKPRGKAIAVTQV